MDFLNADVDQDAREFFRIAIKPNYGAMDFCQDGNEVFAALLDDAINFVRHYPNLCKGVTARELAEDFLNPAG